MDSRENSHRANIFFLRIIRSRKVGFSRVFTFYVHGLKKKKVWKLWSWRVWPSNIFFFPNALISFRKQCGASKGVPGSARYGDTSCRLLTVEARFRFRLTYLRHSSHGQYEALANICAKRRESVPFLQRKKEIGKRATLASRRTMRGARSIKEVGEEVNVWAQVPAIPCAPR